MKSWKINNLGKINLENGELKSDGKVKIRVSSALLDNTDINLLKGNSKLYPITPSHIAIGNVSEEYQDLGLKFGEKVLISPYIASEKSQDEKVFISKIVETMGIDQDGFLADYVAVNRKNVFPLPDSVEDNQALFVEDIALGIKILSNLDVDKGETIVIIGGSSLSILLCQLAIYYQAIPILIDVDDARISIAGDMGVYYTINPTETDVLGQILSFTSGRMADYVIYDSSSNTALQPALQYCRKHGTIAIVGHNKTTASIELNKILEKQLKVVGINNGYGEIATAINLLATNSIDTSFIQTSSVKFDKADDALEDAARYPNLDVNIIVDLT